MKTGLAAGLRDRACPVCGSRDQSAVFAPEAIDESRLDAYAFASRKTPEYMHYRLISCPECDLLYACPAPEPGALAAAYKEAAFGSSEEAGFAARTYSRLLSDIVDRLPDRKGALDIGAGDGAFLEELVSLGFSDVLGIEPSEAPIAAAREKVRPLLKRGVFAAADYQAGTMSLVTSFQTLEHVSNPLEVAQGAHRLLKDGGAAFFICHDRRALSARVLGFKSPIFDIEHLQLFSAASARALLERAGFDGIEVRAISNRYPLHYWLRLFPWPPSWKERLVSWSKAAGFGSWTFALPAGNIAAIGYKRAAAGGKE
jgi:SAM-dependent methyltransferase